MYDYVLKLSALRIYCKTRGFVKSHTIKQYVLSVLNVNLEEFIQKWTAPYRKIVEQNLHYGDGPTPAGKTPATLSQCLARGFAVGSIQKAKKEMRNAE